MDDTQAKRDALEAELVKVMNRTPKTPHEQERRIERMAELQRQINELRTAGGQMK